MTDKTAVKRYKVHGTFIDDYSHTQALVEMVMAESYDAQANLLRRARELLQDCGATMRSRCDAEDFMPDDLAEQLQAISAFLAELDKPPA